MKTTAYPSGITQVQLFDIGTEFKC